MGSMISTPGRLMLYSSIIFWMLDFLPNRMGCAIFSSRTTLTALRTDRFSASAKTTFLMSCFALVSMTLERVLVLPSLSESWFSYESQSVMGDFATPDSMAARATAGATVVMSLGSTGFGMM